MDKYTFLARHGAGSYAVVWKARRKSDGKLVAIKQLKDTVTSWEEVKALAEVQYLGKLRNHPNVIRLEEVVKMHDQVRLVRGDTAAASYIAARVRTLRLVAAVVPAFGFDRVLSVVFGVPGVLGVQLL